MLPSFVKCDSVWQYFVVAFYGTSTIQMVPDVLHTAEMLG